MKYIKRMERYAKGVEGFLYEDLEVDYTVDGNMVKVSLYWTQDGVTKSKKVEEVFIDFFSEWVFGGEAKDTITLMVKKMSKVTEPEVKYVLVKNETKVPVYDLKAFAIKKGVSLSELADVVTGKIEHAGGYYSEASWEAHLAKQAEKASKPKQEKTYTKPEPKPKKPVDVDTDAAFDVALKKVLDKEKDVEERRAKRQAAERKKKVVVKESKCKTTERKKKVVVKAPKQPRKELHTVPTYNVASKKGILKAGGYKNCGKRTSTISLTVYRYEDDAPVIITNIRAFAKEHGVTEMNVYNLNNGKNKYIQSKTTGEVFYREGGKPKTFVISHREEGKKVMFWSIKEGSKEAGINYSTLYALVNGRSKALKGWVLEHTL